MEDSKEQKDDYVKPTEYNVEQKEQFEIDFGVDALKEQDQLEQNQNYELRRAVKKSEKNTPYVLKILKDENQNDQQNYSQTSEFIDDLKTIFAVRHSNIVRYHTLYKVDNKTILVMENTMSKLSDKNEQFKDMKAILKLQKCIDVLEYLKVYHKIAHGNLCPDNIRLDDKENWKFYEFGQNCQIKDNGAPCLIDSNTYKSNSIYRSPELFQFIVSKNEVNLEIDWEKEDMFSLGVILFQIITGLSKNELECINSNKNSSEQLIKNKLEKRKLFLTLIKGMCNWDPKARFNLAQLKECLSLNTKIK